MFKTRSILSEMAENIVEKSKNMGKKRRSSIFGYNETTYSDSVCLFQWKYPNDYVKQLENEKKYWLNCVEEIIENAVKKGELGEEIEVKQSLLTMEQLDFFNSLPTEEAYVDNRLNFVTEAIFELDLLRNKQVQQLKMLDKINEKILKEVHKDLICQDISKVTLESNKVI